MNDKESRAVRMLAEATTQEARSNALSCIYRAASRCSDEFIARIQVLAREAETNARTLRPLGSDWVRVRRNTGAELDGSGGLRQNIRPCERNKGVITDLRPGPDPIGMDNALAQIDEWVGFWMEIDRIMEAGATAPGPILLCGPPGVGKSMLTQAISRRLEPVYLSGVIEAHNVTESHLGQTGAGIAKAFECVKEPPAFLVVEEIDALGICRGGSSAIDGELARVTIALMRILDQHTAPVVFTTNRFDILDPALIRRFEIVLDIPNPTPEVHGEIVAFHLGVASDLGAKIAGHLNGHAVNDTVPIAKRARRHAVLSGKDPVDIFAAMVKTTKPRTSVTGESL